MGLTLEGHEIESAVLRVHRLDGTIFETAVTMTPAGRFTLPFAPEDAGAARELIVRYRNGGEVVFDNPQTLSNQPRPEHE